MKRTTARRVAMVSCATAMMLGLPRLSPAQSEGFKDFVCERVATTVQYDADMVAVGCSNPDNGIAWFALAGAGSKAASQALAVALSARAAQRSLYLRYRLDPNTVPGCNSNCRELVWIGDWGY